MKKHINAEHLSMIAAMIFNPGINADHAVEVAKHILLQAQTAAEQYNKDIDEQEARSVNG